MCQLARMEEDRVAFRLVTSRPGRKRTVERLRHRWVDSVSSECFASMSVLG